MEPKKKNNKKLWFNVITFIVAFSLAFFVTKKVMSGNGIDPEIKAEIEAANKKCPIQADEVTRIDSIKLGKQRTVNYYYTILVPKDSISKDLANITAGIRKTAQQRFDTAADMKTLRENKINLKYLYNDINGESLTDFTLKPHSQK